jgi:hypothetical protein
MPIDTQFSFAHFHRQGLAEATLVAAPDLLGLLREFVGHEPAEKPTRGWAGKGFNLIWRPTNTPPNLYLQLMFTDEKLQFTDITGSGVANRGFKQPDIALGAMAYLQEISDSFDHSGQHFEPGVWTRVPPTTAPPEAETVVRMGSIPHGTTINLQGTAQAAPSLDMNALIPPCSITPFVIGKQDDGQTGLVHFDEEKLDKPSDNRTDLARVATLTKEELADPNLLLKQANAGLKFESVTSIFIASDSRLVSAPDVGGGTDNIAFLQGQNEAGANADTPSVSAIYWLQRARDRDGRAIQQLQYSQRVMLNFNGLSWPHITVGTLRPL